MTEKPKSKGYTNPALQAMGIPRLRIPSRNWCIFWAVTGSITALYVYDRRERKKARQAWKDRVAYLADQTLSPMQLPRKVTVYIAPPPGDYLETAMSHFRQYIKPILVAAAVDYEVKSENRQGDIRALVSEEIRNKRRSYLGVPTSESENELQDKELQEAMTAHLEKNDEGGVICVGRGAYKEYMNGLHEGWLGPLEKPEGLDSKDEKQGEQPVGLEQSEQQSELQQEQQPDAQTQQQEPEQLAVGEKQDETTGTEDEESSFAPVHESANQDNKEEQPQEKKSDDDDEEDKRPPVTPPYIRGPEYAEAELPAEFERLAKFEPIAPISHPHILGFLNIPIRIYKFFNRRKLADEMGEATAAVIFSGTRPFDVKEDGDLLVEEEGYWPRKWKQRGLDNKSEWMSDFYVDPRIVSRMQVYDDSQVKSNSTSGSSEFTNDV